MAGRIKLTPAQLQAQGAEMNSLAADYEGLFSKIQAELKSVNGNWSANLSHNFEGKLNSTKKTFQEIAKDLRKGAEVAGTCAVTYESVDSQLAKMYCDDEPASDGKNLPSSVVASWIVDLYRQYAEIINGAGTLEEKKDAVIKWLKGITGTVNGIKEKISWLANKKIKLPEPIKSGFDFIKYLDIGNKLGAGGVHWANGIFGGDTDEAIDGGGDLISGCLDIFGMMADFEDLRADFGAGIILDYGENMVKNWLTGLKEETEVLGVYWRTFGKSAVDVFESTVCNTANLAIGYYPAKILTGIVGFDLQGAYEKVSDKTGFAAVTDTFAQMGELFEENATWANWKSGMSVIGNTISGWFKK